MSLNYFLLPSDIRLVDQSNLNNNKISLKYNRELCFSNVKLCKINLKNEIQLLETINLSDKKNLKDLTLKYPNLDNRLNKICSTDDINSTLSGTLVS